MKVLYLTEVTSTGGRDGRVRSSDGVLDMELTSPRELGGKGGQLPNPEQLFGAGYSACFNNALIYEGRKRKLATNDAVVTAQIGFATSAEGNSLTVALTINLPSLSRPDALKLVEECHRLCPYSRAIRNNIDVGITVV